MLSKPGKKSMEEREKCAQACEEFTKIFPLKFDRPLTRKMHVLSLILPKHIREKGLYYEFLCLEQAVKEPTTDSTREKLFGPPFVVKKVDTLK